MRLKVYYMHQYLPIFPPSRAVQWFFCNYCKTKNVFSLTWQLLNYGFEFCDQRDDNSYYYGWHNTICYIGSCGPKRTATTRIWLDRPKIGLFCLFDAVDRPHKCPLPFQNSPFTELLQLHVKIKLYGLGESGLCCLFDCPHFYLEFYYYPEFFPAHTLGEKSHYGVSYFYYLKAVNG